MDIILAVDIGTLVVASVGVAGGLIALRQANRQRMLELGNLYIQRFWRIDEDLLTLPKGSVEHTHARHRYLRLCEDEFEAAQRAWLDPQQWSVWHNWLTTVRARQALADDLESCGADVDHFERLRACLSGESGHSWTACASRLLP